MFELWQIDHTMLFHEKHMEHQLVLFTVMMLEHIQVYCLLLLYLDTYLCYTFVFDETFLNVL
jgi:hypothetical protein